MKTVQQTIEEAVSRALEAVLGAEGRGEEPGVRPTREARFGDFQTSVALGLAKRRKAQPRALAEQLVAAIELPACERPEVAGPGHINFRLRPAWLAERLGSVQADPRLGVARAEKPQRVVVDFSSPNLAKEMHVGHLRSTIIGDAIARLLEFEGHEVLRLNHVGDWGTQFGMLLAYVRETHPEVLASEGAASLKLADLEAFYRDAKARFDSDPAFKTASQAAVVELQSGDPAARRVWRAFCDESMRHASEIYARLGVTLEARGESFYNPMLGPLVDELVARGLAVESEGALCVFPSARDEAGRPKYRTREGTALPLIVRKKDGGFNYDSTDLAALRHRVEQERADRIVYVTDVRQRQHFEMFFCAARDAGWLPDRVEVTHVGFGMVLGKDGKPFKTRTGGTVRLRELLDEAEARALAAVEAKREEAAARAAQDPDLARNLPPPLAPAQRAEVARVVGLGAVKYADLKNTLESDYVFDWDQMLKLEGNTAPYVLYVYARVRGIARRAGVDYAALPRDLALTLEHPSELALARQLAALPDALARATRELHPHHVIEYAYALAGAFTDFYSPSAGVRVIDAEPAALRNSRLRLCDMTARALALCLGLLGMETTDVM